MRVFCKSTEKVPCLWSGSPLRFRFPQVEETWLKTRHFGFALILPVGDSQSLVWPSRSAFCPISKMHKAEVAILAKKLVRFSRIAQTSIQSCTIQPTFVGQVDQKVHFEKIYTGISLRQKFRFFAKKRFFEFCDFSRKSMQKALRPSQELSKHGKKMAQKLRINKLFLKKLFLPSASLTKICQNLLS